MPESEEDTDALVSAFDDEGFAAEPLGTVRYLCACCSTGSVGPTASVLDGEQEALIAAPRDAAAGLLTVWRDGRPEGRRWTHLAER